MAIAGAVAMVARAISSVTDVSTEDANEAIDQSVIESAVDDRGIGAIADIAVLRSAIDEEKIGSGIDDDDLQRYVEKQLRENE